MATSWDSLPLARKRETIIDLRDATDALARSAAPLRSTQTTSPTASNAVVMTVSAADIASRLGDQSTSEHLVSAIQLWNAAASAVKAALPASAWFVSPYANNDTLRWVAALYGPVDVSAMASASDISTAASTWAHLLPEVNATTGVNADVFRSFATRWSQEPVTTTASFKRARMLQSSLDGELQGKRAAVTPPPPAPGHGTGTGGPLPVVATSKPMETEVIAAIVVASVAGVALIAAISWSILRNKKGEFKRPSRPPPPLGDVRRAGRRGQ